MTNILEAIDDPALLGASISRMDAYEAKKDGAEAAMMDRKKDAEIEERGDPKELKADAFVDSSEVRNELSEIQSDADRASSAWNESARTPWNNETPDQYRRRVARPHQRHSRLWGQVDLKELSGQALKNASQQIFKDSYEMACSNTPWEGSDLREVRRTDPEIGHRIKEWLRFDGLINRPATGIEAVYQERAAPPTL